MTPPESVDAIPDDVWEIARSLRGAVLWESNSAVEHIARAIMADRSRNAPDTGGTEPVAWQWRSRPLSTTSGKLGGWTDWQFGRAPFKSVRNYVAEERPLYLTAPTPAASPACGGEAEPGLTLAMLQQAHVERQEEWCPDQKPDLSFRGNEMAGEVGEACNVIKKLERERHGWRGSRATKEQLAEELADVIHTATLCAITAGIDIEPATVAKFNATSEKNGLAHRICSAPPSPEQGGCLQDVVAMSADPESRRVLKLHFNRDVTDEDRQRLCALHNAVASPEQGEVVRCALTEARRFVEAERDQRGESDVLYPIPTTLVLAQIDAALAKIGGAS